MVRCTQKPASNNGIGKYNKRIRVFITLGEYSSVIKPSVIHPVAHDFFYQLLCSINCDKLYKIIPLHANEPLIISGSLAKRILKSVGYRYQKHITRSSPILIINVLLSLYGIRP